MNKILKLNWPPKDNVKRLPYGYVRNKDAPPGAKLKGGDPNLAVPNPDILKYVEQAFEYLEGGAKLREASDWLTSISGEPITYGGLRKLWIENCPDSLVLKQRAEKKHARKKTAMSREERKEWLRREKIRSEKTRLANTKKRIQSLKKEIDEVKGVVKEEQWSKVQHEGIDPEDVIKQAEENDQEVVFKPNPGPQETFLASDEQEVLYGGAAGGGKSYALLADPMRHFDNKNFNGLIVRRTNDELRELIWKSQELYPKAFPGAKWGTKSSEWRFPSGARLWFTYLERDEDVRRYQGQAFSYIAFDELTQYPTSFPWDYLRSRLRSTDPNLPVYMRGTTNPGGPGHGWVKRMFIDPAPYGEAFWATDTESGELLKDRDGKPLFKRKFIPAKLKDNPYLYQDGKYENNLLSLSEQQRRQLLEGDWHVADGAAFGEFRYDKHVCKPFNIPHTWRRFRSCDFGYSSHSAVHWYAIDPTYGSLYVYRELYVSKLTGRDLARKVLELEQGEKVSYGVLDSSVWATRGQSGPTIAEEMISEGCRWRPSDRSSGARTAGKNRLHELLKIEEFVDGTELPGIIFFENCRQIISDLPIIPAHPDGKEDIDDRYASDHAYDSIRYGIMTRPRPTGVFEDAYGGGRTQSLYQASDHTFGY